MRKIFIKGRPTREGRGVSQKTIADRGGGYELLFLADEICKQPLMQTCIPITWTELLSVTAPAAYIFMNGLILPFMNLRQAGSSIPCAMNIAPEHCAFN